MGATGNGKKGNSIWLLCALVNFQKMECCTDININTTVSKYIYLPEYKNFFFQAYMFMLDPSILLFYTDQYKSLLYLV